MNFVKKENRKDFKFGVGIMKAVIAIDSLKGSLSSMEAGNSVAEGIRRVYKDPEIKVAPLADGGEGTVEALSDGMGGRKYSVLVTGPLGDPVWCEYGIMESTKTAVIEMAGAAGLPLVPVEKRNPLYTTTYGVGEVILDAIKKGCRRFIVGIGGSATNDGGVGMLQALGYEFLDKDGKQIPRGARGLKALAEIACDNVVSELMECEFHIACDVTNPLCGEAGCSAVYGSQKGADDDMVVQMDLWMKNYAQVTKKQFPKADPEYPGAGAAGGMGFAFMAFTRGALESGIKIVLKEIELEKEFRDADVVVTGEGRLDGQTAMGKAPVGVAAMAKRYGIPVIAFSGSVTKEARKCNEKGIDAFFPILREVGTLEEAMDSKNAKNNLADTAEQVFRLWKVCNEK